LAKHPSDDVPRHLGEDAPESAAVDPSGPFAYALEPTYSPSREGSTPSPGDILSRGSAIEWRAHSGAVAAEPRVGFWERSGASGGSTTAPPVVFVGRILANRWEVGPRVGLGGMASVHQGLDHRLGRQVAIKILHPHVAENPDSRTRLAREARAIAQLRHENVIEVYDYSIDDPDCTWLVTELIEGLSLRQFLDRNPRPMPEIGVMICAEVVRALRAAHAQGVVHRDVKPDNILVGKDGRPKLSDFGIAQVVNEQRMTLTGNLVGSPSYMSPEQANGKRTDHRTDLYSTGILLYRLTTGTLPFRGETAIETIRKVSDGDFIDPVELEPGCAGPIAGIIRRALSPNIEDRFQTADELLQAFGVVLADAGLSATWEELPKFFADPAEHTRALRPRLAKELEARGRALLDGGQEARAVDCFNRALSLGEGNQRTHDLVRELSKRRGKGSVKKALVAMAVAITAVAVVSGVLLVTDRALRSDAAEKIAQPAPAPIAEAPPAPRAEPELDKRAAIEAPKLEAEPPAPVVEEKAEAPRHKARTRRSAKKAEAEPKARAMISAALPPLEPAVEAPKSEPPPPALDEPVRPIYGTLQVGTALWADILVDGKPIGSTKDNRHRFPLAPGTHKLRAEHPNCIPYEREFNITAGETTKLKLQIICP
jgi:serine/threonine-protein kinase